MVQRECGISPFNISGLGIFLRKKLLVTVNLKHSLRWVLWSVGRLRNLHLQIEDEDLDKMKIYSKSHRNGMPLRLSVVWTKVW